MKKRVALLLVVALLLTLFGAHAEGLDLKDVAPDQGLIQKNTLPNKRSTLPNKAVRTSDVVEDRDGRLIITTSFGVTLSLETTPDCIPLTQNYFRDIVLYNAIYEDPAAQIQHFIDNEMHLNMFNENFVDCYVYVYEQKNTLSEMVGDLNALKEADVSVVGNYLSSVNGVPVDYGIIGDQLWYVFNLMEEESRLVLFTYVNGHCVAAYIENVSLPSDIEAALNMVSRLHFGAL